uniref:Uncharacterized protein n=1 Tax=Glossina pallidipes TaxID=7398 RepID=A0A1B0ACE7_GLOPL
MAQAQNLVENFVVVLSMRTSIPDAGILKTSSVVIKIARIEAQEEVIISREAVCEVHSRAIKQKYVESGESDVLDAVILSGGKRDFVACGVTVLQENPFTTPYGVCPQFLIEFAKKDFPLNVTKSDLPPYRALCTSIGELLPKRFSLT